MIPLIPGDSRMTAIPVNRPVLWKYYQDAIKSFWTVDEVSVVQDAVDWHKLSPPMQHAVKHILAFFAASDNIVNVNIMERFIGDVPIYEATRFYNMQVAMEDIHANMYAVLLETIVPERAEVERLLDAVNHFPVIADMSAYMTETIKSDRPFNERVLRMACVEGIFFTSCFCIIYWLQSKQLMPGLGQSNELIARDEMLHTAFALELYTMCPQLSVSTVHSIFEEAVQIAVKFATAAIPEGIPEMNIRLMTPYIKTCANNLLAMINVEPLYGMGRDDTGATGHDFHFMEKINLKQRTNFFERRVSDYGRAQTASTVDEVDDDF